MINSMKTMGVIILLLVFLVLVRINSVTVPKDIENKWHVVYVQELTDCANAFNINWSEDGFIFKSLHPEIQLNGKKCPQAILRGGETISYRGHQWRFATFPSIREFKTIIDAPIFPEPGNSLNPAARTIGGFRHEAERDLQQPAVRELLAQLLLEISPAILQTLIPDEIHFDGQLFEIIQSADPGIEDGNLFLAVRSMLTAILDMAVIHEGERYPLQQGITSPIFYGDLLTITGHEVTLEFRFEPYARIVNELDKNGQLIAIDRTFLRLSYLQIKSLETQGGSNYAGLQDIHSANRYSLAKGKENVFMGGDGLFSFSLMPRKLFFEKQLIPDMVNRGFPSDFARLLDKKAYFWKKNILQPVSLEFLANVQGAASLSKIQDLYSNEQIIWREGTDIALLQRQAREAESVVRLMERKGVMKAFSRELKKLDYKILPKDMLNLQLDMVMAGEGKQLELLSDREWQASVNGFSWKPVRLDPKFAFPIGTAPPSIWFDEDWLPWFSGLKVRYFRREFGLEFKPEKIEKKILYASGFSAVRINGRKVRQDLDWLTALHPGKNIIEIEIGMPGRTKPKSRSDMLEIHGRDIQLKQSWQSRENSFRETAKNLRARIVDQSGHILAYDAMINGRRQRFYSEEQSNLAPILGHLGAGLPGLDSILQKAYDDLPLEQVQLTLNVRMQQIALACLREKINSLIRQEANKALGLQREVDGLKSQWEKLLDEQNAGTKIDRNRLHEGLELYHQLQKKETILQKIKNPFYEGAVILLDGNGRLLASCSYPSLEKEDLATISDILTKRIPDRKSPLLNRGLKWLYNPGSAFKIVDTITFLEARKCFPYLAKLLKAYPFSGIDSVNLENKKMLNGKEITFGLANDKNESIPFRNCTLDQAFIHSYNTYFAYLALHANRLFTEDSLIFTDPKTFLSKADFPLSFAHDNFPLLKYAEALGMNQSFDLLDNLQDTPLQGLLLRSANDPCQVEASQFPRNLYSPANIAHYAIGGAELMTTALQNAVSALAILKNGNMPHPSLIQRLVFRDRAEQTMECPPRSNDRLFSAATALWTKEAMKKVMEIGTARLLKKKILKKAGYTYYAKTGTAETELFKENSVFCGFLEMPGNRQIVFSVVIPRSGYGLDVAGDLTINILNQIVFSDSGGK